MWGKEDNERAADIQDRIVMISEGNGREDNFRTLLSLFLSVVCSIKAISIILGDIAASKTCKYCSAQFHLCLASQAVSCQNLGQAANHYGGNRCQPTLVCPCTVEGSNICAKLGLTQQEENTGKKKKN